MTASLLALPLHPALPILLGALLLPLLRDRWRQAWLVALPVASFANLLQWSAGDSSTVEVAGYALELVRVDKLSLLFGYLFHLALLLASIYSIHVRSWVQPTTGALYAASAIGVVFAGDLLVLFLFWELLALTSVFQIWTRGTERARRAGMRYLLVHVASGLLLFAGALAHLYQFGSLEFRAMSLDGRDGVAAWLLLGAFGIKCAFPLLHTWLVDAYPEATEAGAVFLSAFTTKAAVYALARGFAGNDELIWIGTAMAMFPIFFAVIENDLRRVLGYSMINQIGFMVVGIGLGEGLGLNGAVAHAFNDVLFKGLLFMSMGAVLLRTGTVKGSELGGLYKSMPWTAGFCMVGAASISAFPLFSGFVSKSMVMAEAAHRGEVGVWLFLLFASAGVFHHAGIKIPFFAFYAHDSGLRPKEAPWNMLVAMGLAAVLCVVIGCAPGLLYGLLPSTVEYAPYTATHVVQQLQLLFFSALAFATLMLTGIYPPELRSTNLDVDWTLRRLVPALARPFVALGRRCTVSVVDVALRGGSAVSSVLRRLHRPPGRLGEPWPTGATAFWAALVLALYLLFGLLELGK
jgi:multicomponent Na+:H+ antiporter subunit D